MSTFEKKSNFANLVKSAQIIFHLNALPVVMNVRPSATWKFINLL